MTVNSRIKCFAGTLSFHMVHDLIVDMRKLVCALHTALLCTYNLVGKV